MFCNKCGAVVPDGARVCGVCGQPLDASQVAANQAAQGVNTPPPLVNQPYAQNAAAPQKKSHLGLILGLSLGLGIPLLIILVGFIFVFPSITNNAQKKSCMSNQRVIKGNMETYAMTGDNGDQVEFPYGDTVLSDDLPRNFTNLFDGGELPTCPTHGYEYYVCVHVGSDGTKYIVRCTDPNCDHNS